MTISVWISSGSITREAGGLVAVIVGRVEECDGRALGTAGGAAP